MYNRNKNKNTQGFTLIELLVVVAIIALLSSIALIALIQARQKGRDAKRLGDITQMNNAMELYFTTNRGYPSDSAGVPQNMTPSYLVTIPTAPTPEDGVCAGLQHVCGGAGQPPCGISANTYYYVASGTPFTSGSLTLYPDYAYYFCLGQPTGSFSAGEHWVTPHGIR